MTFDAVNRTNMIVKKVTALLPLICVAKAF